MSTVQATPWVWREFTFKEYREIARKLHPEELETSNHDSTVLRKSIERHNVVAIIVLGILTLLTGLFLLLAAKNIIPVGLKHLHPWIGGGVMCGSLLFFIIAAVVRRCVTVRIEREKIRATHVQHYNELTPFVPEGAYVAFRQLKNYFVIDKTAEQPLCGEVSEDRLPAGHQIWDQDRAYAALTTVLPTLADLYSVLPQAIQLKVPKLKEGIWSCTALALEPNPSQFYDDEVEQKEPTPAKAITLFDILNPLIRPQLAFGETFLVSGKTVQGRPLLIEWTRTDSEVATTPRDITIKMGNLSLLDRRTLDSLFN